MGKVLVLYYSKTGRTQAMAELVAEGATTVEGIEVRLKSIDEATVDDLFWCDGIALGAPTHLGSVPWKMKKWWDDITDPAWQAVDGKFGCAFSSEGGLGGGAELACMGLLTILMNYGLLVFGVTDYVAPLRTLHYGAALPGRPKEQSEIDICKRLGLRLAEWVAYYVDGNEQMHPLKAEYSRKG
ncbi:flavodoxin family protein [Chloroflexota bacterium]